MTERSTEVISRLKEEIERTKGPVPLGRIDQIFSPNARVIDPEEQQRIKGERLQTALDIETGKTKLPKESNMGHDGFIWS